MHDPNQIKVLVLDDDVDYFNIVKTYLKHANPNLTYLVDWVNNYEDAAQAVHENQHDVYLIDYNLNEKWTGLDLLKLAQELNCVRPFIMLTSEESVDVDDKALEFGATGLLYKPDMTPRILDQQIRYGLKRSETTRKLMDTQMQLRSLAHIDPLTGLPNRTAVIHEINRAIDKSARTQHFGAILFLDLDDFKPINDSHGHHAGDKVLKEAAARISRSLRRTDIVGRLGGDEFVIVMPDLPEDANLEFAINRVAKKIISMLEKPFPIADEEDAQVTNLAHVSASIGVAVFPFDGRSAEDLLNKADSAMYKAKEAGKNRVRFFSLHRDRNKDQANV